MPRFSVFVARLLFIMVIQDKKNKIMERHYELFDKVLKAIYGHKGGDLKITFTADNVAEGDDFLNFHTYPEITCTFTRGCPIVVLFDCDEPILLENCPDSFLESIVKNAE